MDFVRASSVHEANFVLDVTMHDYQSGVPRVCVRGDYEWNQMTGWLFEPIYNLRIVSLNLQQVA